MGGVFGAMTVYGNVVAAIEILLFLILLVPFILWANFKFKKGFFPREIKNEVLVIVAGLVIPLVILHVTFDGLNDWEMGLTGLEGAIVPPLVVIWLSFMFWTTLTPSAIVLIGIRLGLIQDKFGPTEARRIWDYFRSWNKLLRIYGELNKWGAILIFLGFTIGLPIYINTVDSEPTAYLLFCLPLFITILLFSQDRSKVPKSTNFSTPTGLPEYVETMGRMQGTGFMEMVEAGGGEVIGDEGIVERLQDTPPQVPENEISQVQNYTYAKQPLKAIIFALLCPGLDRFYLGDSRKGILFLVSALVLLPTIFGTLVLWAINLATVAKRTDAYNLNSTSMDGH